MAFSGGKSQRVSSEEEAILVEEPFWSSFRVPFKGIYGVLQDLRV